MIPKNKIEKSDTIKQLLLTFIKDNAFILGAIGIYFVIRLMFLTSLPIYSDETVYLDWAWRETHVPGYLFYSLYDAKTPLLLWMWGISETILQDPLFAGRFVSVLVGLLSAFGLYQIGKDVFSKKVGLVAFFLYTITPIFYFYDRQVLFESGVTACGIWSCYVLLKLVNTGRIKFAWILGIVLGLGFFVKISSIIFLFNVVTILGVYVLVKKKAKVFGFLAIILCAFLLTDLLLFIRPDFWQSIYDNLNTERFLTLREIFHFPFILWGANFWKNLQIMFFFLTPPILIAGSWGIIESLQSKNIIQMLTASFCLLSLFFQLLFLRNAIQRYLDPFLPFFVVFAAAETVRFFNQKKLLVTIGVGLSIALALGICLFQAVSPAQYFIQGNKITTFVDKANYYDGITSGWGVDAPIKYIQKIANGKKTFVSFAINSGTPESAFIVYFQHSPNIVAGYMTSSMISDDLTTIDCLKAPMQVYFVARDDQQAGLNKFLVKVKTFHNPFNTNVITVYKLKSPCIGRSVEIAVRRT